MISNRVASLNFKKRKRATPTCVLTATCDFCGMSQCKCIVQKTNTRCKLKCAKGVQMNKECCHLHQNAKNCIFESNNNGNNCGASKATTTVLTSNSDVPKYVPFS